MSRKRRLEDWIAAAQSAPTIGVDDCGPWVARWVEQETNLPLRFPPYSTREDGYRIVRESGGFVALTKALLPLSIFETSEPRLGDIGVIALSNRETIGIFCTNGVIVLRGERFGVSFLRPRAPTILKAWAIPEC